MGLLAKLKSKDIIYNLPNLLTLLRILMIPLMAVLLAYDSDQPPFGKDFTFRYSPGRLSTLVLVLAGITDLLDGYFARLWKIETLLGKFLDPLADKLFVMVGLIMLLELDRVGAWLVLLLLSREVLITGLRGVAAGEGIIIAADQAGKWKTFFQLVGLGFLMWYGNVGNFRAYKIGTVILYVALFFSMISGYRYLRDFLIKLHERRAS